MWRYAAGLGLSADCALLRPPLPSVRTGQAADARTSKSRGEGSAPMSRCNMPPRRSFGRRVGAAALAAALATTAGLWAPAAAGAADTGDTSQKEVYSALEI